MCGLRCTKVSTIRLHRLEYAHFSLLECLRSGISLGLSPDFGALQSINQPKQQSTGSPPTIAVSVAVKVCSTTLVLSMTSVETQTIGLVRRSSMA